MMKNTLILIFCLSCLNLFSQNDLLKIDDDNISLNEFKNIFFKNNEDVEITKEYLDEYVDLFINFKLKVKEAEA